MKEEALMAAEEWKLKTEPMEGIFTYLLPVKS
jgi:hypothetical protein